MSKILSLDKNTLLTYLPVVVEKILMILLKMCDI